MMELIKYDLYWYILVVHLLKYWTYIVLHNIIFIYTVYMKCIHIYAYMLVCYNCAVRHRYRVWNIWHVVALVSCLQKSMCHVALSYDTSDILLSIAGGKSGGIDVSIILSVAFDETYETHGHWSIAVTNRYYPQRYLKYWTKLYHNYMSDFNVHIIYMISAVTCFFVFVFWGVGGRPHVTKYQPDPKSHCSRKGLKFLCHVTSPTIYCKHSQTKKCEKK